LQAKRKTAHRHRGSKFRPPRRVVASIRVDLSGAFRRLRRPMPRLNERARHLLGLFAYHRDAPLVARALRVPLETLDAALTSLGLRGPAYPPSRGTEAMRPGAAAAGAPTAPPVPRRARPGATPPPAQSPMPAR